MGGKMEQPPKPQAVLDNWRRIGQRIYGHPIGHPAYSPEVTLGIRPVDASEDLETGSVVQTAIAEYRLGQASRLGPKAVRHLIDIPYV